MEEEKPLGSNEWLNRYISFSLFYSYKDKMIETVSGFTLPIIYAVMKKESHRDVLLPLLGSHGRVSAGLAKPRSQVMWRMLPLSFFLGI